MLPKWISQFFSTNKEGSVTVHGDVQGSIINVNIGCNNTKTPKSSKVISETIPFTTSPCKMQIRGSFDVHWKRSDRVHVELQVEEHVLPYITVHMHDDKLIIGMKSNCTISATKPLRVFVESREMHDVRQSGSGSVQMDDVQQESINATLEGSGRVMLSGQVVHMTISKTGSGHFNSERLQADTVSLYQAGSGKNNIQCNKTLNLDMNGSGNVVIHGNPAKRNVQKNGSGRVEFK